MALRGATKVLAYLDAKRDTEREALGLGMASEAAYLNTGAVFPREVCPSYWASWGVSVSVIEAAVTTHYEEI